MWLLSLQWMYLQLYFRVFESVPQCWWLTKMCFVSLCDCSWSEGKFNWDSVGWIPRQSSLLYPFNQAVCCFHLWHADVKRSWAQIFIFTCFHFYFHLQSVKHRCNWSKSNRTVSFSFLYDWQCVFLNLLIFRYSQGLQRGGR